MNPSHAIGHVDAFDASKETWDSYIERLDQYFIVNDIGDAKKVAALLSVIGATTYQLLRGLAAPAKPAELRYDVLTEKLREYLSPKPVVISERFRFFKRDQRETESIREYIAEIRRLSEHCEFKDTLSEALRDKFVCGLRSENIQKRLLSEQNLSFERAVEISQAMETASRDASELQEKHKRDFHRECTMWM